MKKFLALVVVFGFMGMLLCAPSKSFSSDNSYINQLSDNSKNVNNYVANGAVLKALQNVLLDAQKSQYAPDKTIYALDALKFTMQVDPSVLTGFIKPLADVVIKMPIDLLKAIFPMLQGAVQNLLGTISSLGKVPTSSKDVMMLQELQLAIDEAIQSNYETVKVSYAINQLEKVVTQSGFSIDQLLGLVSPIIDIFKNFATTIPTQIMGILSDLMGTLTGVLSGLGGGLGGGILSK
jgi:phage-related protein